MKNILILGASGTIGSALFKQLSCRKDYKVVGTYFSSLQEDHSSMMRFCLENPDDINSVLKYVQPDIVISSIRGDFEKQLIAHEITAKYLTKNNGRLLYISTANVFDGSCDKPHFETDSPISDSDYGKFKIECEELLTNQMGDRAVLLRIPFVWGKNSPRIQALKAGCDIGKLDIYADFFSNHVSDMQIVDFIQWIIDKEKGGIFHIGTSDVISYQSFIERLISTMELKKPEFVSKESSGIMAVLSNRKDVPDGLQWDSEKLIRYLCRINSSFRHTTLWNGT